MRWRRSNETSACGMNLITKLDALLGRRCVCGLANSVPSERDIDAWRGSGPKIIERRYAGYGDAGCGIGGRRA